VTESWLSALKSPELIFAVMLTAKTCLVVKEALSLTKGLTRNTKLLEHRVGFGAPQPG